MNWVVRFRGFTGRWYGRTIPRLLRAARRSLGVAVNVRERRVHIGCGPHNHLDGWWNTDIRWFKGIDEVMDATRPWPLRNVEYAFAEHFLEHLSPLEGVDFIEQAWRAMRPGGVLRLSTPSLEWVLATHFRDPPPDEKGRLADSLRINRAFHGWGHRFLYSREYLNHVLSQLGWRDIRFCAYGESERAALEGIECHGKFTFEQGYPSCWIVEATRPKGAPRSTVRVLRKEIEESIERFLRSGH